MRQVAFFKEIYKYKDLLHQLVMRDVKLKYKRSVLGVLWSVLNPLAFMIIMSVVFSTLFKSSIEHFAVYLLCGQLVFSFVSEATNSAMTAITGNAGLINKVYLPKYIFPLSKVMAAFVNLLYSLIALFIVLVFTDYTLIKMTYIMIPFAFLMQFMFALGVGYILASSAVFFRDVIHLYNIGLTMIMYLSAIFYPIDILPEQYRWLIKFNPLYDLIWYFRKIVLDGVWPGTNLTVGCFFVSLAVLLMGIWVFKKRENDFILYM